MKKRNTLQAASDCFIKPSHSVFFKRPSLDFAKPRHPFTDTVHKFERKQPSGVSAMGRPNMSSFRWRSKSCHWQSDLPSECESYQKCRKVSCLCTDDCGSLAEMKYCWDKTLVKMTNSEKQAACDLAQTLKTVFLMRKTSSNHCSSTISISIGAFLLAVLRSSKMQCTSRTIYRFLQWSMCKASSIFKASAT